MTFKLKIPSDSDSQVVVVMRVSQFVYKNRILFSLVFVFLVVLVLVSLYTPRHHIVNAAHSHYLKPMDQQEPFWLSESMELRDSDKGKGWIAKKFIKEGTKLIVEDPLGLGSLQSEVVDDGLRRMLNNASLYQHWLEIAPRDAGKRLTREKIDEKCTVNSFHTETR